MQRTILIGPFFTLLASCSTSEHPPAPAASAPRTCALIRGAYCIEQSGLIIREQPLEDGHFRLTVYEERWSQLPIVIDEPGRCAGALSDTIEVRSIQDVGARLEISLRLVRDGQCDLTISVGDEESDPAGNGILTALTQIRSCETRPCSGRIIAGVIRGRFGWRFN